MQGLSLLNYMEGLLKSLESFFLDSVEGWWLVQLSPVIKLVSIIIGVSSRFMDLCTIIITVHMPLGHNVEDEVFLGFPGSPWSITKFGLGRVPTRVSEKGPCDAFGVCSVCVKERKMEYNSSGVKTCKCVLLETLGVLLTEGSTWNPYWELFP